MLFILFIFCLILPGVYAYLSGRRFFTMTRDDEFALKYFKYLNASGVIFFVCFFTLVVLIQIYGSKNKVIMVFEQYTLGFCYVIFSVLFYGFFIYGLSLVDQVVRETRVNIITRIKFNLSLVFLMSWPYVFYVLVAFGSGKYYMVKVVILCGLFFLVYLFTPYFWRVLLRARLVKDEPRVREVDDINLKTKLEQTNIFIFSTWGMKFANAFTVGNFGGEHGIFISDYAYENLTGGELLAIYAHEIGHLQRHQVLRRSFAFVLPLLAISVVNIILGGQMSVLPWALCIFALIFIKVVVPSQQYEKEADLFAIKAGLDTEVFISGLEKIHRLGILPTRFTPSDDKKFSHPSLTKRIAYIRKAAGQPSPILGEEKEFNCIDKKASTISFCKTHFVIHNVDGSVETTPYEEIVSMFPVSKKDGSTLSIKYRDKSKVRRIVLKESYQDLSETISVIETQFAETPLVDVSQFRRHYLLLSIVAIIFGFMYSFFARPVLLILGIIGLFKKSRIMLFSYFIVCVITIIGTVLIADQRIAIKNILIFGHASVGFIALIKYIEFRKLVEKIKGDGWASFVFSAITSFLQLCILVLMVGSGLNKDVTHVYQVLFINLSSLSFGLLFSSNPKAKRRRILIVINLLLFLIFVGLSIH